MIDHSRRSLALLAAALFLILAWVERAATTAPLRGW